MSMSPEGAVAPTAQAPPDRATLSLEKWAQDGVALLFGDHVLDMNERRILRGFMEEVAQRAQNGGIGTGVTPGVEPPPEAQPAAGDPNATEDYGTEAGATAMSGDESNPWSQ